MTSKMTSIKLEDERLEIAKMLGQGNMSGGIKNCLDLMHDIISKRYTIDEVHNRIEKLSGESETMRRTRTKLMNELALVRQPKIIKPKKEVFLTDEEIAAKLKKRQYDETTSEVRYVMNLGKIGYLEAREFLIGHGKEDEIGELIE